tara:strand:- start:720 stop:1013 length:294 start_codon:yes stop_codon:yes gene_type:complete
MFVEIGALVQKDIGQQAVDGLKDEEGIRIIALETGRSSDLFDKKDFGDFGEAAIVTIIADDDLKDSVFDKLFSICELHDKRQGLVFMSPVITKTTVS